MNRNKKTKNIKTNQSINNMGNSNSVDALNAVNTNVHVKSSSRNK